MMLSPTNLVTGISGSKVKYLRLSSTDDAYTLAVSLRKNTLEKRKNTLKIPYKTIALTTVLFFMGAFFIIGSLLLAVSTKGRLDHSVLIIGVLVFLPEFYHPSISYYVSKGYCGYSYR
ncbi:transmembrane protein 230-like [Enhydra lutris kenyoni]|uniref:Transmembrane protein 230 n=1 Tax=Enhydra lutris kenyoni TaxID=391180 RepID=A0A2Y9IYT6_ENHLU|nr:transmembrane protein 230-like [Enhydra lutris kenyoni]